MDGMGIVISIAPMEMESVVSAVPLEDEPVSDDNEMSAPAEEPTVFDQFSESQRWSERVREAPEGRLHN